jgi:hypothetical protein
VNTVLTVYTVYIRFTVNTVNTVMADLSLKGLDGELMVKVKVRALDCGMTLREFVTRLLEEAVDGGNSDGRDGVRVRGSVARGKRQRGSSEELRRAQEETGSPVQSGTVDRGPKTDRGGERAGEVTAVVLTGERVDHDPNTCRLYRCGLCFIAKRGLK